MCGSAAALRRSGNFCEAQLVDEMHLAVSSRVLGAGENLFAGLDLPKLGYQTVDSVRTPTTTHVVIGKQH